MTSTASIAEDAGRSEATQAVFSRAASELHRMAELSDALQEAIGGLLDAAETVSADAANGLQSADRLRQSASALAEFFEHLTDDLRTSGLIDIDRAASGLGLRDVAARLRAGDTEIWSDTDDDGECDFF